MVLITKASLNLWRLFLNIDFQAQDTLKESAQRSQIRLRHCRGKRMMGKHPHHPMAVSIAGRELRQALIAILTSETAKEGITTFDLRMFIFMIMLLVMNKDQGIEKPVHFVVYLTVAFPSVGKEWQHL